MVVILVRIILDPKVDSSRQTYINIKNSVANCKPAELNVVRLQCYLFRILKIYNWLDDVCPSVCM